MQKTCTDNKDKITYKQMETKGNSEFKPKWHNKKEKDKKPSIVLGISDCKIMPEVVTHISKSYLLDLITIEVKVEDKRPGTIAINKYRHQIDIKIFWKKFAFIIFSTNPTGLYKIDNEVKTLLDLK